MINYVILSKSNQSDKRVYVDPTALNSVLNLVLQAVSLLTERGETDDQTRDVTDSAKVATEQVKEANARVQLDELDECRQRSFKGNLIVTSLAFPPKGRVCLIKSDEQLKQDNKASLIM